MEFPAYHKNWNRKDAQRQRIRDEFPRLALDFDTSTTNAWTRLLAGLKQLGKAMPIKDSLSAAMAKKNHWVVVCPVDTRAHMSNRPESRTPSAEMTERIATDVCGVRSFMVFGWSTDRHLREENIVLPAIVLPIVYDG